jgi:hypothetical protein
MHVWFEERNYYSVPNFRQERLVRQCAYMISRVVSHERPSTTRLELRKFQARQPAATSGADACGVVAIDAFSSDSVPASR